MNIIAISDLHGYLPTMTGEAEVMLIAGDISPLDIQFNKPKMFNWLETEFKDWIDSLPVEKVFLIAGNHDAFFESMTDTKKYEFQKIFGGKLKYLENETTVYFDSNGISWTIFGAPYCHIFGWGWPFMRSEEYMEEKFKDIPDNVDIIISHDPPYGVGEVDVILEDVRHGADELHRGNIPLSKRLSQIKYKYLFCGHIHSGAHSLTSFNGGSCINVSVKDEFYKPSYTPFYFEI